eukprot:7236481-Alexandrium_andersonii.AAC.1
MQLRTSELSMVPLAPVQKPKSLQGGTASTSSGLTVSPSSASSWAPANLALRRKGAPASW